MPRRLWQKDRYVQQKLNYKGTKAQHRQNRWKKVGKNGCYQSKHTHRGQNRYSHTCERCRLFGILQKRFVFFQIDSIQNLGCVPVISLWWSYFTWHLLRRLISILDEQYLISDEYSGSAHGSLNTQQFVQNEDEHMNYTFLRLHFSVKKPAQGRPIWAAQQILSSIPWLDHWWAGLFSDFLAKEWSLIKVSSYLLIAQLILSDIPG